MFAHLKGIRTPAGAALPGALRKNTMIAGTHQNPPAWCLFPGLLSSWSPYQQVHDAELGDASFLPVRLRGGARWRQPPFTCYRSILREQPTRCDSQLRQHPAFTVRVWRLQELWWFLCNFPGDLRYDKRSRVISSKRNTIELYAV